MILVLVIVIALKILVNGMLIVILALPMDAATRTQAQVMVFMQCVKRPTVTTSGVQCLNGEPILPPPTHRLYQCFEIRSFEADVYVTIGKLGFDCKVTALGVKGNTPTQSNLVISIDCVTTPPSNDPIIKVAVDWISTNCYPGVSTTSDHSSLSTTTTTSKRQGSSNVYSVTVDQASDSGLSGGAIAGIVIGCVVAAILIVAIVAVLFFVSSKRRHEKV